MPITTPRIRLAGSEDVSVIVDYNIALCLETERKELDYETVVRGVTRFINEPARGRYFVAVVNGAVIGQAAHTCEWSDWRAGEFWWIESVYVHPAHRGHGVFRALYRHIRQLGETDPDCCGLRLYMERENDTARRSYLRLGFEPTAYELFEVLF